MLLDYLRAEESFDVIAKPIKIGGRSALLLMIDGFVKDDIMEKVMQFFLSAKESDLAKWSTPELFAEAMIPPVPSRHAALRSRTTIACCAEQGMVSLKRWSLIRRWCAGGFGIHN